MSLAHYGNSSAAFPAAAVRHGAFVSRAFPVTLQGDVYKRQELKLYVGKAINSAYQNPGLPFDLGIRQNLVEQLKHTVEEMGKKVTVTYY